MEKVKILWSGITGRTGKEAVEIAKESDSVEISAGLSRNNENYYNYDELDNIKEDFDVIVDFSHKDSFDRVLDFALKVKKPIVIGTAGLTEEQMRRFEEASKIIPVFRGGNFRFDVKKFIDEVVEYVKKSEKESFDLIETHYKTKKVPSETAKVVAKRVLEEAGKQVNINSYLEYDELINDWKIDDLHCRVVGFKELAENVLEIAKMMKDKTPSGVYDLDRLLKEQELIDLHKFLIEAKKETYANETAPIVTSTRRGSRDYEYIKDNWTYHDTYFGGIDFQGQEVVYHRGDTPTWGMVYYGRTLDESLSEEAMDKALRRALMQVGQDDTIPVRGPKEFENQGYKYTFKVTGDLTNFEGEETIEKEGAKIYTLKCHGGRIRK